MFAVNSKGRVTLPKRMNFRKSSKRPLTPHFRKITLQFFSTKIGKDKNTDNQTKMPLANEKANKISDNHVLIKMAMDCSDYVPSSLRSWMRT